MASCSARRSAARSGRNRYSRLLAQRGRYVIVRAAVVRFPLAAGDQHLGRTFLGGVGIEALARLVALALAERVGGGLAVRRAVDGDRAKGASRHHRGWLGQSRQRVARVLGAGVQIVDGLARTLQRRQDLAEQLAHFMNQAWILGRLRRSGRRRIGLRRRWWLSLLPSLFPSLFLDAERRCGRLRPGGSRINRP